MLRNRVVQVVGCASTCAVIVLLTRVQVHAQWEPKSALSASSTIRLSAYKPSSISVSVGEVPLALDFSPRVGSQLFAFPVTTTWNLNPNETPGFEVVAYFANPEQALTTIHREAPFRPVTFSDEWMEIGICRSTRSIG